MRKITLKEFQTELKAQGVEREHFAFVCPVCSTVQSGTSLIKAGTAKNFALVETQIGFSCVGRFTNAGPHKKENPPGKGCDWTLGGLFRIHKLEVIGPDGAIHPYFEIATPEQAQFLKASWPINLEERIHDAFNHHGAVSKALRNP